MKHLGSRWLVVAAALALGGCDLGLPAPRMAAPQPRPLDTAEPCLVRAIGPDGIVTRLERAHFDRDGRLLARTTRDYAGDSARDDAWAYDGRGRLVAYRSVIEDALGTRSTGELHGYDAAGDRVRTTTLSGEDIALVVERRFDAAGRPVAVSTRARREPIRAEATRYDAAGRVVERSEMALPAGPERVWRLGYDEAGRLSERIVTLDGARASAERWVWTADGRLRASAFDRDGDGVDDHRERVVDRADGYERLVDGDGDGRDDWRVLVRVEEGRETRWTDADADGRFDAVVVVVRDGGETVTWSDDDADGRPERVVVEIEGPGYAETRYDDDGDGVIDGRHRLWTDAEGGLAREEIQGADGALVALTIARRDAAGRLSHLRRFGPDGVAAGRVEYGYRCSWNPRPLP